MDIMGVWESGTFALRGGLLGSLREGVSHFLDIKASTIRSMNFIYIILDLQVPYLMMWKYRLFVKLRSEEIVAATPVYLVSEADV